MSNKKISQFQVVTTLNGTTYVPVIQGSPLFDAIISASNFATSLQDYNDNFYIKLDGTNSDIDVLNFNQNPQAVNLTTAQFAWAAADGTFAYGVEDGGLIQLSKELFDYYVNVDTVPLVNGDVVSIVPISGNRKAIARTNVTNGQSAKNCIGMVTVASIAVGATGRVTKFGEVHDLLTQLYPDGTELFVSESNAGKWATVGATPPNYTVKIGTVIVSQNGNGIVELGIQCFPKLGDLSDVNGVSSSVNKPIVRKADGVIDAIDTALDIDGISPSSGTLTVTGDLSVDDITSDVVGANTVNVTDLNATDVESTNGFVKTGSSNNQVLLGAGGTKNVADFQLKSEKGQANGYASLDSNGLVPSTQLPSFVDDIIEVANYAALPVTGETGKIYVTLDTNKAYRWSGSTYVYITSGAVDSVAGKTGVVTLVKADVGLANVDNTSDANKPISTATQTALNGKVNNTGDETIAGIKTFSSSPIVPNPTTSGQAMNKGTADGAYVALTGNQTVAGVKTFSSSPIVPTPTNGTDAANKDYVTNSVIGAMPAATAKLAPELAYYTRVLADSGVIKDLEELTKLYLNDLELDKYSLFKWSGWSGVKTRTSGSNVYVAKAYDNSTNNNDAVQATEANQPFYAGNIAPNEVGGLKNVAYASNKKVGLTSPISFAAGASFSIDFDINIFAFADGAARRIFLNSSSSAWIEFSTDGYIKLFGNYSVISSTLFDKAKYLGKINKIQIVKNGTTTYVFINGQSVATSYADASILFNEINLSGITGILYTFAIYNIALPKYRTDEKYISSKLPEIEGIAIGNQFIATSNYEGGIAGDGSVINEVQYTAANSPEIITNAADREFSSDTGFWIKTAQVTIGGGVANIKSTDGSIQSITKIALMPTAKWMKVKYDIIRNGGGSLTIDAATSTNIDSTVGVNKVAYIYSSTGTFSIKRNGITDIDIDNLSVKEVGWDEAQALYDYVYAQTTGTAAVKDLAATKAAAMWSYYNNDALNGAIYGKLYNWWAVKLISLYPPKGWRVPSSADFTQLQTYLGGSTVAGGKMKAKYGVFDNAFATNESGFSTITGGNRSVNGNFASANAGFLYASNEASSIYGNLYYVTNSGLSLTADSSTGKAFGCSLRLMRNEPVGSISRSITSNVFSTDISVTAKSISIPFGYRVESILIKATTSLTSIVAKLYNSAGAELETLITGKSVNNANKAFIVSADQTELLQDGAVRVTCAGNSDNGMEIVLNLQKLIISE